MQTHEPGKDNPHDTQQQRCLTIILMPQTTPDRLMLRDTPLLTLRRYFGNSAFLTAALKLLRRAGTKLVSTLDASDGALDAGKAASSTCPWRWHNYQAKIHAHGRIPSPWVVLKKRPMPSHAGC